jgi:hypothetical protein
MGALTSAILVGIASHVLAAYSPVFRYWLIITWGGGLVLLLINPALGAAWWLFWMTAAIVGGLLFLMLAYWWLLLGWVLGFVMFALLLIGIGDLVR